MTEMRTLVNPLHSRSIYPILVSFRDFSEHGLIGDEISTNLGPSRILLQVRGKIYLLVTKRYRDSKREIEEKERERKYNFHGNITAILRAVSSFNKDEVYNTRYTRFHARFCSAEDLVYLSTPANSNFRAFAHGLARSRPNRPKIDR